MSSLRDRFQYFRRIFKVYLTPRKGYLSFWHEEPAVSEGITRDTLGPYYMTFADKTHYHGPRDSSGVILLDYFFDIGRQYNPLAIAQYGLGHFNLYLKTKHPAHLAEAHAQADWLVRNLEEERGMFVWKHHFRWHYKQYLAPGWYSAHSQGAGISLLARMYGETHDERYREAAVRAFKALDTDVQCGGVRVVDSRGDVWLEEYVVTPPTHILNGYIWGLWGVWDYYLLTNDSAGKRLWDRCVQTLIRNLPKYDAGFWSLYDLSRQRMRMVVSHFYHKLHIVQLQIMYILTKEKLFLEYRDRFAHYERGVLNRVCALIYKTVFKLLYF